MKSLGPICMDIYRQLFKEATPSTDFDMLVRTGIAKKKDFFLNYYLDDDRQDAIIAEHCKKNHLNRAEREAVRTTVFLGCAPSGIKKPKVNHCLLYKRGKECPLIGPDRHCGKNPCHLEISSPFREVH